MVKLTVLVTRADIVKTSINCIAHILFASIFNGLSYSMKHADVQLVLFLQVIKREYCLLAREANPREYYFEIHYVVMINRIEAINYIKLECISIGIFGISRIHFLIIL